MSSTNAHADTQAAEVSPHFRLPFSYDQVAGLAAAVDVIVITLASVASGLGYHLLRYGSPGDVTNSLGIAAALAAIVLPSLKSRGLYEPAELLSFRRQAVALTVAWVGAFVFLAGLAFLLKVGSTFSRGTVLALVMSGWSALILHRMSWRLLLRKGLASGHLQGRRVALLSHGGRSQSSQLSSMLERHGFQVVRHLLLPDAHQVQPAEFRLAVLSTLGSVRGSDIEEIFIAADWRDAQDTLQLVEQLRIVPLPVRFIPDPATAALLGRPSQVIGSSVAVEVQRAPLTALERALKRGLDLLIAGAGLLAVSPLLVLIALAIRLDSPGPVIFRQARNGFNGRRFTILKFRTMTVLEDGAVVRQASRNDARVTRVGYWLRRTSLDELPQLMNVLGGDMSIIGPRPHAIAHDNHYDALIAHYALRHHMKPGITGWAQVNGFRGETPRIELMKRRVDLDLWYIRNWSFWLDLQILARTALALLRDRAAY